MHNRSLGPQVIFGCLLCLFSGCERRATEPVVDSAADTAPAAHAEGLESQPLHFELSDHVASTEAQDEETQFELLPPSRTGIDFINPIDNSHPLKAIYVGGFASAGIAIGDVNADGLQDVYITGGPVKNRLYLQTGQPDSAGSFRFRDATASAGVDGGDAWGAGATMADIDNDGDLDIYVCNYDSPNQLYINETTSSDAVRFVESAKAFGLDVVDACLTSGFCDYDRDGDLDVFIVGYQYVNPAGRPSVLPVIQRQGRYYVKPGYRKYYGIVLGGSGGFVFTNVGREDYLLQSNASEAGDGQITFANVTKRSGIEGLGVGNSFLWLDYDDDGLSDLYIANDFKVADQLYRNNGDGTFTDVIEKTFSHTTWFSMGSEAGDVNNDGMTDLLVTDMAGTTHYRAKVTQGEKHVNNDLFLKIRVPRQVMRNALMVNTGTGRFLEAANMAGIAKTDWTWGTKLADLDNDGWLDAFFTNGATRMLNHSDVKFTSAQRIGKTQWQLWENTPPRLEENLAFRNLGDLRFENVSAKWGLDKRGMSYSAAYGDLDNDGDLDLIVANLDEPIGVYRNRSRHGHRLRIRLVGTRSNRFGLGAVVRIETAQGQQMRQMTPAMGFMSCNEPFLHFGLGEADRVTELIVDWPSAVRQVFRDLEADRLYTVTEPDNGAPRPEPSLPRKTVFVRSKTFPALRHIEKEFDDFARQPLLPYKHSQLGPGLAVGDVDGDGDTDYYLARPKGSRRAVYTNEGKGRFVVKSTEPFQSETDYEDMGALLFDADKDGDRDLYVVSGSVECQREDETLRDRLYLNDGSGQFTKADGASLPDARDSGSVVCAADFDRDGDLDLFVGGRVVPGEYPSIPTSRLLANHSQPGKPAFKDATDSVAPGLAATGLVTGAVWSDANGDGWLDLLVTHEWGLVKYFRNEAHSEEATHVRRLVDRTLEAGLAGRFGLWNGIAGRDMDNDGDVDYIVTNFGLNTTYQASRDEPALMYYGDFDGSGKSHIVEARYENGKRFPRRGLTDLGRAMPLVMQKMKTFHNFGHATLQQICTEKNLDRSLRLQVNTLESAVLINQGSLDDQHPIPHFRFHALPALAQISPSFGVAIDDFDADGWPDCILAQNFFSPRLETGRMDSGLSLLLRGRGGGLDDTIEFEPVWPKQSGIVIPGDAKAASVVDINEDGWSDLVVTVNDGTTEAFECQPHDVNRPFRVKLAGPPGNLDCVGAAVTLRFKDSTVRPQLAEVFAGGGYLSQSFRTLVFGCGENQQPQSIHVRWPDGRSTVHAIEEGQYDSVVRQP
jgi:hypothetical protein